MMKSLLDRVAFVSGAGRGVGRAIALSLAQHGAKVALQDITPVNLAETLDLIRPHGTQALELVGDMSKKMQVQGMIEQAREALGDINLMVNQWAVAPEASLLEIDEWDWDRTMGINLKGYFLAIQSMGRLMSDQGQGTIINVVVPPTRFEQSRNYPVYEVSAAGVRELTHQAALELYPKGVHVLGVEAEREQISLLDIDPEGSRVGVTWWQTDPLLFASAVVDVYSKADQYRSGQELIVTSTGQIQEKGTT